MRVLVTGAEGFLGQRLCAELAQRWPGVSIGKIGTPPRHDLRDPRVIEWCRLLEPDIVFHLAAQHFVPWCRENPRETLEVNSMCTADLVRACASAKTFVLASSAAVYGLSPTPRHYGETDRTRPDDVYGLSKVWAEEALRQSWSPDRRLIAARLFNLVGLNDPTPHLFPIVYRAQGGTARVDLEALRWARDFVHVDDAAVSLVDLAAVGPAGYTEVNVCTGVATTGWDLVKMYGVDTRDNPAARRTGGGHLIGDPNRLRTLTGRAPGEPFERLGGRDRG